MSYNAMFNYAFVTERQQLPGLLLACFALAACRSTMAPKKLIQLYTARI